MSQVEFDQNELGSKFGNFGKPPPLVGLLMRWGVKSETSANKILIGIAVFAVVLAGIILVRQWSGGDENVGTGFPNQEQFTTGEF